MVILCGIIRFVVLGIHNSLRLKLADIDFFADQHRVRFLKAGSRVVVQERQSGTRYFILISSADPAAIDQLLAKFFRKEADGKVL